MFGNIFECLMSSMERQVKLLNLKQKIIFALFLYSLLRGVNQAEKWVKVSYPIELYAFFPKNITPNPSYDMSDQRFWTSCEAKIGVKLSREIVELRPWNNKKINWLRMSKIKGIGDVKLESLRKCLYDPPR